MYVMSPMFVFVVPTVCNKLAVLLNVIEPPETVISFCKVMVSPEAMVTTEGLFTVQLQPDRFPNPAPALVKLLLKIKALFVSGATDQLAGVLPLYKALLYIAACTETTTVFGGVQEPYFI